MEREAVEVSFQSKSEVNIFCLFYILHTMDTTAAEKCTVGDDGDIKSSNLYQEQQKGKQIFN